MTVGISAACSGSQISTSDGLYLLAEMKVTNRGEAVALEMDVERGGFVDVKVLTCTKNVLFLAMKRLMYYMHKTHIANEYKKDHIFELQGKI